MRNVAPARTSSIVSLCRSSPASPICCAISADGCWLDKYLIADIAAAYQNLWPCVLLLIDDVQGTIDLFMCDRTVCQWKHAMASACSQARLSIAIDGEAHVVAIMPGNITWHGIQQGWIVEAANVEQQLLYYVSVST